jgi:amino-acid N-acetyltransferase
VQADKLIYLCDAAGVVSAKGALIDALTADEAQKIVGKYLQAQAPEIVRVLPSAVRACRAGRWACSLS